MGFANLPNQVYRKSVKRGFEFTLMVVGKLKLSFSDPLKRLFVCVCASPSQTPGHPSLTRSPLCVRTACFHFCVRMWVSSTG